MSDLGLTFLSGDPPRAGRFVLYEPQRPVQSASAKNTAAPDGTVALEVVLPTASGSGVRRRRVACRPIPVAEALAVVPGLDPAVQGAQAWAAAILRGLDLIAKGRLYPAVTAAGWDCWRAGPVDPADRRALAELAASFPAAAHPIALKGSSPLRLRSPASLILEAWDALADTMPRTAAAHLAGSELFASTVPQAAAHLGDWLADASGGLGGGGGVDLALRVELVDAGAPDLFLAELAAGDEELEELAGRAVVQLTSRADPSLVVDAADLYSSPAAVLATLGEDAETDLVRGLRRGARAFEPLDALLHEQAPSALLLDEDLLAELLATGAGLLGDAGIEVLWPSSILSDGFKVRAFVAAPGKIDSDVLSLGHLVDWRWEATLDGEALSPEELDQLSEAKRGLVRLRGRFLAIDPAALERLKALRSRRLSLGEALGALLAGTVDLDGEPVEVVADELVGAMRDRVLNISGREQDELPAPPGLDPGVELRPYQTRGITWLASMAAAGLGACLADDMGLGKTLQVIALHLHRTAGGQGPTLVVCPTSLVGNWEREVRRFAPSVAVRRYHGASRSLEQVAPGEIVVTTYGVARREPDELARSGFSMVVADEAQHAKNPETAAAKALRRIAAASPARVALTGTPVENRLSELWSILDWTTPGLLGSLDGFVRSFARPIERDHDALATERLARAVRPFVLRRRKTDPAVAPDLPERVVTDVPVPLTREQVTLYEAEVREAMAAIQGERPGIARQALVLKLLMALKQICNHPAQYLHQPGPLPGRSGKLAALEELVDVITAEGESVLVFSQFVECLHLLEARLAQLGTTTLLLHGGLGARRRMALVDAFQAGEAPVMLLSLKAGGVGLNLTRATHVVHFDRWWNPAVEDQATDRAHRIGQTRSVQVHRLMAEGTLEDRIAVLIENKRALAESVVGAGESWIGQLSNEDLANLVRLGSSA